jgi:hypothetical protein
MAERETEFAQVISTSGDHAKYNDCAKKLVAYKAIIAWIKTKDYGRTAFLNIQSRKMKSAEDPG